MLKIRKGDEVTITAGKDKGKRGKVERVSDSAKTVFLPGLNIYKKHLKKRDEKSQGGVINFSRPVQIASVALICPKCNKPTRVGFKMLGEKKVRTCKKCKSML